MDWKALVGSVAPILGTAIGGPFGGVAGKFLADALGTDEAGLPDMVANANPETLMQIKNLDAEFKVKMKELGISEEQLHAQDRDSARKMATSTSLLPQGIIAAVFITGFIVVLYMVFKGDAEIDGPMKDAALMLLGILSAGVTQIMNFFFGSSSGSKQKTNKMMSNQIQ